MKNVLIICTNRMDRNGMATVIMNYYWYMNRKNLKFDFIVNEYIDPAFKKSILDNGDNIFVIKSRKKALLPYIWRVRQIVSSKKYDVVHIHGNSSTVCVELFAVKHVKGKIIVHAHGVQTNHPIVHRLFHNYLIKHCDIALAASEQAGLFLFGRDKDFTVIINGIDFVKYRFDSEKRKIFRNEYNVADETRLILNIGAFTKEKNQAFLIRVFRSICNQNSNYKLVLVGDGPLLKENKKLTTDLGLTDSIIFTGEQVNVSKIYSAADVFTLPSLYESFGIVGLEAQANGLPCILAERIPKSVDVSGSSKFLPVDDYNVERWSSEIMNAQRTSENGNKYKEWEDNGYSIKTIAEEVRNIYEED
ncbi:glycosyltransferase [Levilactobacillus andaensis]|uniref:glycosyltransferase n=1 Tax=Levilactobacillus andaensis TaxID=2799570 RepID=UPI0019432514|nr:glycosyltransferase [Levilactobacillus andaensis]